LKVSKKRKGETKAMKISSGITIREMQEKDISNVLELLKTCNIYYPNVDTKENFSKKLIKDKKLMLVAMQNEKIVGFVMALYDGWIAFVFHLGVLPDLRKKGIGGLLFKEIEERLKDEGAERVNVLVSNDNILSKNFFLNSGFEITGQDYILGKNF